MPGYTDASGSGDAMLERFGRTPELTIPVSEPLTKFQKYYATVAVVSDFIIGIIAGYYVAFVLGPGIPDLQAAGIALMILMPLGGIIVYLLFTATLQRGAWPVHLYKDGIEVHQFTFDKLIRRASFVPSSTIAKVVLCRYSGPCAGRPPRPPFMKFVTTKRTEYTTGPRAEADLVRALEFIRIEWPFTQVVEETISADGRRVEAEVPLERPPEKARKVAVPPVPVSVPAPTSKTLFEARPPTAPSGPPARPTAVRFCPSCGAALADGSRFCPGCGHQLGSSVQPRPVMYGQPIKSPTVAVVLSLLPGLLGFPGLGQFYVRKYAKGALLLIIGSFFALMGLGSLLLMNEPPYAGTASIVVVVVFFNVVFLMLLAYSVIDARKGAMSLNQGTR